MKKMKLLLVLIALAGAFSVKAVQPRTTMYVLNTLSQTIVELDDASGACFESEEDVYCEYILKPLHLPTGDPDDYDPVESTRFMEWVPNGEQ
jgi:hypothetical protein